MKIDFFTIVFEGDKYIEACIEQIIPHANRLIIAEGAVKLMAETKGYFRSKDKTLKIIDKLKKKYNNIFFIQVGRPWQDKVEMKNAILNYVVGDIFWQVDYDEFYRDEDINNIHNTFQNNPDIDIIRFPAYHFWKNYIDYRIGHGTKWDMQNYRVFRNVGYIEYTQHFGPHRDGILYDIRSFKTIDCKNRMRYHYGYVESPKHIKDKVKFMSARDKHRIQDYENDLNCWSGEEKPKVKQYTGKHPREIQKLIERGVLK